MDLTVILGIVGAVVAISVGDILDGGNPLHLIHLASRATCKSPDSPSDLRLLEV